MISLIRTQLIAILSLNSLRDKKKRFKTLFLAVAIVIGFSPTYIGLIVFFNKAYRFTGAYQLPSDLILTGMYSASQLMVLLLGVSMVFSTLIRSKDLSILLPLPYTPLQIIASKMSVAYLFELAISAVILVPIFVLNIIYTHPSLGQILNGILCMLLLPVIPLMLCSILTVLVANIPKIGRNKWFSHLVTVASVLVVSFSMTTLSYVNSSQAADMIRLRMQQTTQMARMVPGSVFGARALVSSGFDGFLNQVLNIAVAGLYVAVLFFIAGRLYIGPILRGDYVKRSRVRRGEKFKARSFIVSYIRKELATTLKDPMVAMNGLGSYIMIPVLLITYTVMKVQTKGQVDVNGMLIRAINDARIPELVPILSVSIALVLAFLGASSSLFSATYSKDGKRLWIEKTLPIDPFTVFKSKLLTTMLLVTLLNVITVLVFAWIFPLGFWMLFYALLLSEIIILYSGIIGMLIDCRRPKVEWKDTVQAVKQNVNVLIAFAYTLLLIAFNLLIIYGCYKYHVSPSGIYISIMSINVVLLAAAIAIARRLSQGLREVVV